MSDEAKRSIRSAVANPDRAFQVIDGGGGNPPAPVPPASDDSCPLVPLGHLDGVFYWLDSTGQLRALSARQLGNRHDLVALFLGDDRWLRRRFPKTVRQKKDVDGKSIEEDVTVDFLLNRAAAWLQAECGRQGLYGDHVVIRRPGIWAAVDGLPVVHAGDKVMISGEWQNSGVRAEGQVWAAAPPAPRPAAGCDASVGQELQQSVQLLWNFRQPGSDIVVLGLIAIGYLGVSVRWRAAGFIIGQTGFGKSALMSLMRACTPMHHYSNDTSKAGIEQAVDGRSMPIYIDEAKDTDPRAARMLIDVVLTATGGDGTQGHRGGLDGRVRTIQMAGSVIMAATTPPEMEPQHLGRFALIECARPDGGADHTADHQRLIDAMRKRGPALWGRVLGAHSRYLRALELYREALGRAGCAPREMDQLGSILAGWWVLTEEGVPSDGHANAGVKALELFVRSADEVAEDSGPRRCIRHLLGSLVQRTHSTERDSIGRMLEFALRLDREEDHGDLHMRRRTAETVLGQHGIRVILATDTRPDARGRTAPRMADGAGVWFAPGAPHLGRLFDGSSFDGGRWVHRLASLESARWSKKNVRIGSVHAGRCLWVSAAELGFDEEEDAPQNATAPP